MGGTENSSPGVIVGLPLPSYILISALDCHTLAVLDPLKYRKVELEVK
ncbi:hypothetical protein FLAT13_00050 [Flavobacterium salmonis]|uniref:Uncharacterized protein n=1 Tax=Flavobacterium salmonis TaxID=2654844 RepID=A0A6V6YM61_9FLAO|nr:hypothetical protein FLAT13_00050 [Flavobacterium salmonis]